MDTTTSFDKLCRICLNEKSSHLTDMAEISKNASQLSYSELIEQIFHINPDVSWFDVIQLCILAINHLKNISERSNQFPASNMQGMRRRSRSFVSLQDELRKCRESSSFILLFRSSWWQWHRNHRTDRVGRDGRWDARGWFVWWDFWDDGEWSNDDRDCPGQKWKSAKKEGDGVGCECETASNERQGEAKSKEGRTGVWWAWQGAYLRDVR